MPRKSVRPQTGHTILVVDDQQETLASVRPLLEREGHCVLTAQSGEQALTVLKRPTGWAEALSRSHAEARPAPPPAGRSSAVGRRSG